MTPQGDPEERSALDDAKEFLSNLLADGPVSNKQIRGDAEGAGIAWRTIQRAQKALGIEAYKGGMKGGWLWKLPAKNVYQSDR
jgi:putative DNA primase/helicase